MMVWPSNPTLVVATGMLALAQPLAATLRAM
jgi:hypothetical protein